jgi:hypothetical protein
VAGKSVVITDVAQLPLVVTYDDIGAVLKVSRRTVERMDRAGGLPARLPIVTGESTGKRHPYRTTREQFIGWLQGGTPRRGRR